MCLSLDTFQFGKGNMIFTPGIVPPTPNLLFSLDSQMLPGYQTPISSFHEELFSITTEFPPCTPCPTSFFTFGMCAQKKSRMLNYIVILTLVKIKVWKKCSIITYISKKDPLLMNLKLEMVQASTLAPSSSPGKKKAAAADGTRGITGGEPQASRSWAKLLIREILWVRLSNMAGLFPTWFYNEGYLCLGFSCQRPLSHDMMMSLIPRDLGVKTEWFGLPPLPSHLCSTVKAMFWCQAGFRNEGCTCLQNQPRGNLPDYGF